MSRTPDLNNLILVSHYPKDRTVSPCGSVYQAFIGVDRCFEHAGHVNVTDPPEIIQQSLTAYLPVCSGVLFNSMGSLLTQASVMILEECLRRRLPVYVYWHETAWNLRWFQARYTALFSRVHALLRLVQAEHWVPSVQSQQIICYALGVSESATRVVFEVIDFQRYPHVVAATRAAASPFIVGGGGVPTVRKGTDLFVHLANTIPVVGGRETEFRWYWSQTVGVRFLNAVRTDRMRWMGYAEDFGHELRQMDVFCLTSRDDPSPLVAFDALACDVPVFCLDSTGIAEIVPSAFRCSDIRDMAERVAAFDREAGGWKPGMFRALAESYGVSAFERRVLSAPPRGVSNMGAVDEAVQRGVRASLKSTKSELESRHENELERLKLAELAGGLSRAGGGDIFRSILQRASRAPAPIPTNERRTVVTIVGNSPTVLGTKLGHKVDDSDHVVRINNFRTRGFEADVGTKTTAVFISQACAPNAELDAISRDSIYLYRAHQFSASDDAAVQDRMMRVDGSGLSLGDLQRVEPYLYFHRLRAAMKLGARQWPSTGVVAIAWAMDTFGPSAEIRLHGFSFYSESGTELRHYFNHVTTRDDHHDFDAEKSFVARATKLGRLVALR